MKGVSDGCGKGAGKKRLTENARLAVVTDEGALLEEDCGGVDDVGALLDEVRVFLAAAKEGTPIVNVARCIRTKGVARDSLVG